MKETPLIIWVIQLCNVDDDGRQKVDVLGCALSAVDAEVFIETQLRDRLQGFKRCHLSDDDGSIQLAYAGESTLVSTVSARPHVVYGQVPLWLMN
jgi:hypothetical protein